MNLRDYRTITTGKIDYLAPKKIPKKFRGMYQCNMIMITNSQGKRCVLKLVKQTKKYQKFKIMCFDK